MIVAPDEAGPFREDAERPEVRPFSPSLLRPELQSGAWYAFEDWSPESTNLDALIRSALGQPVWRVEWPELGPTQRILPPSSAKASDVLLNLFRYAGSIIWDDHGRVFANYFSDFLLTNIRAPEAQAVFGCSLSEMWAASENCFTDPGCIDDPQAQLLVRNFVDELKSTWREGAVN